MGWRSWFKSTPTSTATPTPPGPPPAAPPPRPEPPPAAGAQPQLPRPFAAAIALLDRLSLQAPRGWGRLDLAFEPQSGTGLLRVQQLDVRFGATPPGPDAPLHLDPGLQAAFLAGAVTELRDAFRADGHAWDGLRLAVERHPDTFKIICAGPGNAFASLSIQAGALHFGEPFLDAFAARGQSLLARQQALGPRLAALSPRYLWKHDGGTSRIVFVADDGFETVVPATLLGSHSRSDQTWCWAWANRGFAPELLTAVKGLRAQPDGLAVFRHPGFPCEEGFAWDIAMLAADALGGQPAFSRLLEPSGVRVFFAMPTW